MPSFLAFNCNNRADNIGRGADVKEQFFAFEWGCQHRWRCKKLLQVIESCLCFCHPREVVLLLQKLEKRQPAFTKAGNKLI